MHWGRPLTLELAVLIAADLPEEDPDGGDPGEEYVVEGGLHFGTPSLTVRFGDGVRGFDSWTTTGSARARPDFVRAMSSRFIMGLGYGVYLAVDTALVTEVLPASADRGTDMALANLMTSLPYVLVPPIASVVLGSRGGYHSPFLRSAAMSALGAVLARKVKTVR